MSRPRDWYFISTLLLLFGHLFLRDHDCGNSNQRQCGASRTARWHPRSIAILGQSTSEDPQRAAVRQSADAHNRR